MMSVMEALRQRRRELAGRRRELEESGDGLALALVREELMDVDAQLRTLTPRRRAVRPVRVYSDLLEARQQYINWHRADESRHTDHAAMLRAVRDSARVLTDRQREMWDLAEAGMPQVDIARQLGVGKSTVSRTLCRARESMREETKRAAACLQIEDGRLDMGDLRSARMVLSAITPMQAVYLYLYFSNWMSLRKITMLTGRDPSVVSRTIRLALLNISASLGCRAVELANMDALDEVAYPLYCGMRDGSIAAAPERRHTAQNRAAHRMGGEPFSTPVSLTITVVNGYWDGRRKGDGPGRRYGKLLAAILQNEEDVITSLIAVFERL